MNKIRLGVALEHDTTQYCEQEDLGAISYLEYALAVDRGMPAWLKHLREQYAIPLHLHPLDVNLAGSEPLEPWLSKLSAVVAEWNVKALVSDLGFWFLGHGLSTWERPPLFCLPAENCRDRASKIALQCGVPLRVENPPIDWMPGPPCLWTYLETVTSGAGVELCLDLCHLRQYQVNVEQSKSNLPKYFPWERLTEIHLGGCVPVEYLGKKILLDNHLAEIDELQHDLLAEVLEKCGGRRLDVCLEMEPCSIPSFRQAAKKLTGYLAGSVNPIL